MSDKLKGVCFGEILIDVFQEEKKIGGAPLNVATRLCSFGHEIALISAIGDDQDGKTIIYHLEEVGIQSRFVEQLQDFPTGLVLVSLNEKGNATYRINYPAAWDKIRLTADQIKLVKDAAYFVFGSLSSRDAVSAATLRDLLAVAKFKIFDVNLRAPYYELNTILAYAQQADLLKFNDDELYEICGKLGCISKSLEQNIRFISKLTHTAIICVTLGSHGAILYHTDKFYYNAGFRVQVVDTVGSGDSFLAGLILQLFLDTDPQNALNFACAIGSIVAQHQGANPAISLEVISKFME